MSKYTFKFKYKNETRYLYLPIIATLEHKAIEEVSIRPFRGYTNICEYIEEKGNEIIKAIKQLDKKIKNN